MRRVERPGVGFNDIEVECSDCDDGTCDNDKVFSAIEPRLHQLSDEEAERAGATELLLLNGLAIAKGEWKNVVFEADVVKDALERATNLRIDVEHEDDTWDDVKGFSYKPRWNEELGGIEIDGAIFDERVINWHRQNPTSKLGFSVKLGEDSKFEMRGDKKYCTYLTFKGLALTLNPACKVCWVEAAEVVQLNSSVQETDGGEKPMAEKSDAEKKLEEEQKQKKLEEEKKKLAEEKKKEELAAEEKPEEKTPEVKPEDKAGDATPAPVVATPAAPSLTEFNEMKAKLSKLEAEQKSLTDEKSLSEVNTMVNGLVESGQLSEAKRDSATKTLLALSSDEDRAAFLNTIGGNWKAGEQGLVLSEEEKPDEEKDKDLEFSEPERNVIT